MYQAMYIYIYIHICTYVHMYIYIYIHIHICTYRLVQRLLPLPGERPLPDIYYIK